MEEGGKAERVKGKYIVPIQKRNQRDRVEDYRRITAADTV